MIGLIKSQMANSKEGELVGLPGRESKQEEGFRLGKKKERKEKETPGASETQTEETGLIMRAVYTSVISSHHCRKLGGR